MAARECRGHGKLNYKWTKKTIFLRKDIPNKTTILKIRKILTIKGSKPRTLLMSIGQS